MDCMIMCGGNGTRLWPLSRKKLPKQFLKLTDEKYSMFQLTCLRLKKIKSINKIYFVSNVIHNFLIKEQVEELDITNYMIISEPFGKNTCAAIASVSNLSKSENLLVMASDHIWDNELFEKAVDDALKILNNSVVVFGIKPSYPETGYGYINFKDDNLIKFVEKPNLETAKKYIETGEYLWNSGNFLFNIQYLNNSLNKNANDIYENVNETLKNSIFSKNELKLNSKFFEKVRSESIDYAVMEFVNDGKVIKYDGKWIDIGSFKSLYDYLEKDENKNVLQAKTKILNTTKCLLKSDKLVVLNNVEDLTIIDERDSLYIGKTDKSQDVKKLVNMLKEEKDESLIVHAKAYRPWGWYINIEGDDHSGFKVKRIGVYPGKRLSLQSHDHRSEHWVMVRGTAKVQVGKDFHILKKNQHVYIPIGVLHRMENVGDELVEFVETQIGDYLGEDDIVRYEDDFGRV